MTNSMPLSCVFYDAPIPSELETKLIDLYHNAFSVNEFFKLFGKADNYNALTLLSADMKPEHIICYRVIDNYINVLNELIDIEPIYLDYLSHSLFTKYPKITKIKFNRIKSIGQDISSPFRLWSCSTDIIVTLPSTIETYDSSLGNKIKRNMRYYLGKLQCEYPDYKFEVTPTGHAEPSLIRKIIALNRSRMESKSIHSGYDAALENNVAEFSGKYGAVATIRIKDSVVAGIICYDMGSHVFGETIAHDSNYNKFSIGQICFYLTLKHFIGKGSKYFHTMDGSYEYKYRFLGVNQSLISLSIYRSVSHKLFDFQDLFRWKTNMLMKQLRYYRTVLAVAVRNRRIPARRKVVTRCLPV